MNEVLLYMYPHIKNLALAEGLHHHALSILVRLLPDVDTRTLVERFYADEEFGEPKKRRGTIRCCNQVIKCKSTMAQYPSEWRCVSCGYTIPIKRCFRYKEE